MNDLRHRHSQSQCATSSWTNHVPTTELIGIFQLGFVSKCSCFYRKSLKCISLNIQAQMNNTDLHRNINICFFKCLFSHSSKRDTVSNCGRRRVESERFLCTQSMVHMSSLQQQSEELVSLEGTKKSQGEFVSLPSLR